jgi:molybdenum cofactor cytidylyltransferase
MPVDPGNLLVLGALNAIPVIGLPGCARSPKRNGFDWVLERLCADVPVTSQDIMAMGVGGLLKEIPSRPQPRDTPRHQTGPRAAIISALILAAGSSSRMGANKLLLSIAGKPVLAHTLEHVHAADIHPIIVVTGHRSDDIGALIPTGVASVFNPAFASGMASSLKAGLAELPDDIDAVLIVLGDMPAVRSQDIATLAAAFSPEDGRSIVVPVYQGRRGHPIIFARAFWPALLEVVGDQGGRQVLNDNPDAVYEVVIDHPGVLADADTPDALDRLEALMTS